MEKKEPGNQMPTNEWMIQVVASALWEEYQDTLPVRSVARVALTGLMNSGFEVFRPDDCIEGHIVDSGKRDWYDPVLRGLPTNSVLGDLPWHSLYWLVPVEERNRIPLPDIDLPDDPAESYTIPEVG